MSQTSSQPGADPKEGEGGSAPLPRNFFDMNQEEEEVSYKIKIFTWLIEKGVVSTKDNMVKRKWL